MARFTPRAIIAMIAVTLGAFSGVAPAQADPIEMAAQNYDKVSRDGWHLHITIDHEVINSVPNLAGAANSREGFVTASATATATGGSTRSPTACSSSDTSWAASPTYPPACSSAEPRASRHCLGSASGVGYRGLRA